MEVDNECRTSFLSQDRLQYEEERLSTFTDWPVPFISAEELAREGFYYTHVKDLCACAFCGGIHGNWKEGDKPREEHKRLYPNCKFLQRKVLTNVPLIQEKRLTQNLRDVIPDVINHPTSSADICGTGKLNNLQDYNLHGDFVDEIVMDKDYHSRLKTFSSTDSLWYEDVRLSTFIDWPVQFISARDLAQDGFYYLRKKDHCACAFCRIIIGAWEEGDVPREEHKKHFPYCPFIRGEITPNVPMRQCAVEQVSKDVSIPPSSASTGKLDKLKESYSQGGDSNKSGSELAVQSLGFSRYCGPKVEAYVTVETRIQSFKQWPERIKQTPQELAEAGFYYCGLSDHVRCFHCGIGIRNWEVEDCPWEEHAKWSPNCHFVLLMKGIEFVLKIQKKSQPKKAHDQLVSSRGSSSEKHSVEILKQVCEMGFPREVVKKALKQKLIGSGELFTNVETCVEAVLLLLSQNESVSSASTQDLSQSVQQVKQILKMDFPWDIHKAVSQKMIRTELFPSVEECANTVSSSSQDETASSASSQDVSSSFTTSSLYQDVSSQSSVESTSVSSSSEDESVSMELSPSVSGISSSTSSLSESLFISSEESSVCQRSGKTITSKIHQEAKKMMNLLRPKCLKKLDTEAVPEEQEEQSTDKLALELQKMKEDRMCKVCLDKEMDVAFLPCRHMATCGSCAAALDTCPVCRRSIEYAFQIICS